MVDLVRQVAAAYRDGLAEGERRAAERTADLEAQVAALKEALRLLRPGWRAA